MLSKEDNELLTRIGPGTPMGALMREYWVPALLSSEVASPDSDPRRIKLLGEELIAFRDTSGNVGLIQNNCPHRGASLFFGRNEESGLRCVYHGWKFDTSGACIDMPNEPAESDFKSKVKAVAYPTEERAGIVWAYLGARPAPPPLPNFEAVASAGKATARAVQRECNWFQALEGDIDTSHFTFLHDGSLNPEDVKPGTFWYYAFKHRAPRYAVLDTPAGAMYGAYRDAQPGHQYWRIAQYLFPCYTMPPSGVMGLRMSMTAWVPMDDEHTMIYMLSPRGASSTAGAAPQQSGLQSNSSDWHGRFRMIARGANDYQIDRNLQRANKGVDGYTGIVGVNLQDQAVTESMGPIYDRINERLGSSDAMIIRVRRRMIDAARALEERGVTPPGVDDPDAYLVRAGGVILPVDANWIEATSDLRVPFSEHPDLDPSIEGRL
jgi:phthalate 4,5-dioxygenase oxygenase subunit